MEFATPVSGVARKFSYRGGSKLLLTPYSLRSIDSVVFDTDGTNPANTTLTEDDYRLHPRTPKDGVYSMIEFRGFSPVARTSAVDYRPDREVTITGDWGYEEVPAEIAQACVMAVVFRLRNDSDYRAQGGAEEVGRYGSIQFPTLVRQILEPYKVWGVG